MNERSERRAYSYILLRYRHDPLSGEFANVGVLLHEPSSGFFQLRARKTIGRRLAAMFPGISVESFRSTIRSVERGVRRVANSQAGDLFDSFENARTLGEKSLPRDDASFVWGSLGSGITSDPAVELDKLYARFITRYDERTRSARDDAAIWKPVREKLAERNIVDPLVPVVISSRLDDVRFEHAWKNGAWHCYQPISFDLVLGESIRDKAARWAGQLLALENPTEPFKAFFFVGAPANPELQEDYERALGILTLAGNAEVYEENRIEALVDRIEADIRSHDTGS
ncbi:MAG: DUF3037 domain-containing protein [Mycobacteriales bacterium]